MEHIRALELGGADELENMGPAHEACGRRKTRDDHSRTARAKRQKIRHLGAALTRQPLPGSRAGSLKRKVNGTVVVRRPPHDRASLDAEADCGDHRLRAAAENKYPRPSRAVLSAAPAPAYTRNAPGTAAPMANDSQPAEPAQRNGSDERSGRTGEILPTIPGHLDFLFADRPLLPGEDADQYNALLRAIVQQVRPGDVIEAIWVKDVVDLIWEAKRLRRWRAQILQQARLKAAEDLIAPALAEADPFGLDDLTGTAAAALAAGWVTARAEDKERVDAMLRKRGLTAESVAAHGFLIRLPEIERIDRLAQLADQRRDALLRKIERKRTSLAQRARAASEEILDAEPT